VEYCGGSGVSLGLGSGDGFVGPPRPRRPRPSGVGDWLGAVEGELNGSGVGVVGGTWSEGSAVGSADDETSGLVVGAGIGGGGGVLLGAGGVCANETALRPKAVIPTAANAIVRRFKGAPRD
jgi:hypothetical protein